MRMHANHCMLDEPNGLLGDQHTSANQPTSICTSIWMSYLVSETIGLLAMQVTQLQVQPLVLYLLYK